jgi:hypothetical protein
MPAQLLRAKPSVAFNLLVFFITTNSAALIYQQSIRPFEPFGWNAQDCIFLDALLDKRWWIVAASVVGLIRIVL